MSSDTLKLIQIDQKISSIIKDIIKDLEDVAVLLDNQYQALARRMTALELEWAQLADREDPITPLGPNATP